MLVKRVPGSVGLPVTTSRPGLTHPNSIATRTAMEAVSYVAGGAYDRFHGGIFPLPQLFKSKSDPVTSGGRRLIRESMEILFVLRSVSGTYTTACTGSSEFISFIGQANNGVACLSHVESGAPRMRIDIQKAEHITSFLFRK